MDLKKLYEERFSKLVKSTNFDESRDYHWILNNDLAILSLKGMSLDYFYDYIIPFIPEGCAYFEPNNLIINLNYYEVD